MNKRTYEDVLRLLAVLKLSRMRGELDSCLQLSEAKGLSHLEFIRALLLTEEQGREESARHRRLAAAHMPVERTIDAFDFSFQKRYPLGGIREIAVARAIPAAGKEPPHGGRVKKVQQDIASPRR